MAQKKVTLAQLDPTFAPVATTGVYADLTAKPTLGSLAPLSPTGTPSATTYLRGDNTWTTPPGGGSGISEVLSIAYAVAL